MKLGTWVRALANAMRCIQSSIQENEICNYIAFDVSNTLAESNFIFKVVLLMFLLDGQLEPTKTSKWF